MICVCVLVLLHALDAVHDDLAGLEVTQRAVGKTRALGPPQGTVVHDRRRDAAAAGEKRERGRERKCGGVSGCMEGKQEGICVEDERWTEWTN